MSPHSLRLLFVADGRSPIAMNWIGHFLASGAEVHLISSFDCRPEPRLASFHFLPLAFSGVKRDTGGPAEKTFASSPARRARIWGASAVGLRTSLRQWLGPLTLPAAARRLRALVDEIRPDLVHAMRIPYEGMAAALAKPEAPLVISVWGNDFTLHAPSNPMMAHLTRLALIGVQALHADCRRDVRLAHEWGLPPGCRTFVLPGAGGVQADLFYPAPELPAEPLVIQPRGVRAYVKNDIFFRSVLLVLRQRPEARFVCPNMAGEPQALRWVEALGVAGSVDLLPAQTRVQMADWFRRASVAVSPTIHDGTPNTLLEAMACGCLPVAGDLESVREWITPGENGLLVDLSAPQDLAEAVLRALSDGALRQRAHVSNPAIIAGRADHAKVMAQAETIYMEIAGKSRG